MSFLGSSLRGVSVFPLFYTYSFSVTTFSAVVVQVQPYYTTLILQFPDISTQAPPFRLLLPSWNSSVVRRNVQRLLALWSSPQVLSREDRMRYHVQRRVLNFVR